MKWFKLIYFFPKPKLTDRLTAEHNVAVPLLDRQQEEYSAGRKQEAAASATASPATASAPPLDQQSKFLWKQTNKKMVQIRVIVWNVALLVQLRNDDRVSCSDCRRVGYR